MYQSPFGVLRVAAGEPRQDAPRDHLNPSGVRLRVAWGVREDLCHGIDRDAVPLGVAGAKLSSRGQLPCARVQSRQHLWALEQQS